MTVRTGGCACGAVSFRCEAEPVWTAYCHCGDCRRASGAPYALWAGFDAAVVQIAGTIAWRAGRTTTVRRGFCGICGAPLAYADDAIAGDEIYLAAGAFDAPQTLVPQAHAFGGDRLPYSLVSDDLPKFDAFSRHRPETVPQTNF